MCDFRKEEDYEAYFPEGTVHEDEFFYTGDYNFVWDKAKNEKNLRDHGIDFKTAVLVFNDPYALEDQTISILNQKLVNVESVHQSMKRTRSIFPDLKECLVH